MLKTLNGKNYLNVNMLIIKGMLKRRRMSGAVILNNSKDKSFIRVVK